MAQASSGRHCRLNFPTNDRPKRHGAVNRKKFMTPDFCAALTAHRDLFDGWTVLIRKKVSTGRAQTQVSLDLVVQIAHNLAVTIIGEASTNFAAPNACVFPVARHRSRRLPNL